jgi:steroid delta-isomerase-like uncharacterized protein
MKRFVLMIITLGSLLALNAKELHVSEVLDNYMSAWNEHNIKKIETFYADDVTWYDLGYDYTTEGKTAVTKAIIEAFMGSVPDMYWVKNGDTFVSKNTIIYEWVYGGTFSGEWNGVTITNKKFSIKGISTTTIDKDGKIKLQKDYYDLYSFKKQLGLI